MPSPSTDLATLTELGLGIDAGGTQTRWAVVNPSREVVAEGKVGGISGLQLGSASGELQVRANLAQVIEDLPRHLRPARAYLGVTGLGSASDAPASRLKALAANAFGLSIEAIQVGNDIEVAYLDAFQPGAGILVYAGTGSIAAHIDQQGHFHRAGGRGGLLDDAGSGYWIACQALRHIWRQEDEAPGRWQQSAMARAVLAEVGGSDWAASREFIYHRSRGDIGKLALAVATQAEHDPAALLLLQQAGQELARLALVMLNRFGTKPVVLAGRVTQLHPCIAHSMQAALQAVPFAIRHNQAHHAAARLAINQPG